MDRGQRFKDAVYAKAAEKGIHTDVALAAAAGVSENTLRNWWQGKGLELGTLVAVSGVIETPVFDLLEAWQGGPGPRPPTLSQALHDLARELGEARQQRDDVLTRLAKLETVLDALVPQAIQGGRGPRAPRATKGSAG